MSKFPSPLPNGYRVIIDGEEIRIFNDQRIINALNAGKSDEQDGLIFYGRQMQYRRPSLGTFTPYTDEEKILIKQIVGHIFHFQLHCLD